MTDKIGTVLVSIIVIFLTFVICYAPKVTDDHRLEAIAMNIDSNNVRLDSLIQSRVNKTDSLDSLPVVDIAGKLALMKRIEKVGVDIAREQKKSDSLLRRLIITVNNRVE